MIVVHRHDDAVVPEPSYGQGIKVIAGACSLLLFVNFVVYLSANILNAA